MIDILNRCNDLIDRLNDCEEIETRTNCRTCMSSSFYNPNADTYDCLKKLAYYTINYGPIYVSEIYHFLTTSQLLETYFSSVIRPINIMSLGCGFGPDDIALNKYRNSYNLNHMNFNYIGYDKEPLWNNITQTNALPLTRDLLNGINFQNIDILFINKLFSTLKSHNLHTEFLTIFQQALSTLPIGSIIVFNDRNVLNLTEKSVDVGSFHPTMISYGLELVAKYFFNVSREKNGELKAPMNYNTSYIEIHNINNICTIPDGLKNPPMPEATQAVFFVYKKV